jgi:hypothetical protein
MDWKISPPSSRRLGRFIALSHPDRGLLIRAVVLTGLVRLGLSLLPFRRLLAWLPARPSSAAPEGPAPERIGWAVTAASRLVPGADRCLPRALAAQALLRRAGWPAVLSIGFDRGEGGRRRGHAWVESRGAVVVGGGEDLGRYTGVMRVEEWKR